MTGTANSNTMLPPGREVRSVSYGGVLSLDQVTVGIVTALPEEFATVCSVLECQLQIAAAREGGDNVYRLGVIRKEAAAWGIVVAVALLNSMGNVSAAACVTSMVNDCPHLKEIIICGIAGGAARRGVAHSCVSSFHGDAARVFAL